MKKLTRRAFVGASAALAAAGLTGCGSSDETKTQSTYEEDGIPLAVIGTMPTEDLLPMWAAEADGEFESLGVNVDIQTFDSAQNLIAAFTAGELDLIMTDPLRAASLYAAGTDVVMEWYSLGTAPAQGIFGILLAPDSEIETLEDLTTCENGIGLAANTVPQYVFEMLCEDAGVNPDDVPQQEVASLPERYSLVAEGSIDAAALPASWLAVGEAAGMTILATDATGYNHSQSVIVARGEYDSSEEGTAAIELLREAWDNAVKGINDTPEQYRELLVEKANLDDSIADDYDICEYPLSRTEDGSVAVHPAAVLIEPQLEWMLEKGYLEEELTYSSVTGRFSLASEEEEEEEVEEATELTDEEIAELLAEAEEEAEE